MADDAMLKEAEAAEAERRMARWAAIVIPSASVLGAMVVGTMMSAGPAILVLLGGTLLGTIALLWASIRTLSGDAPLPVDLEASAVASSNRGELFEQKRRVLRALKDLEHEHAVGKIDDKDYGTLAARLREEAKTVLREIDAEVDPMREKAEALAREYLAKRGLGSAAKEKEPVESDSDDEVDDRVTCSKCSTSNEPDAAFCKKCGTVLKDAEGEN